jgi:hypothetical protein
LLKTREKQNKGTKEGIIGTGVRAFQAGAFPAELHAHNSIDFRAFAFVQNLGNLQDQRINPSKVPLRNSVLASLMRIPRNSIGITSECVRCAERTQTPLEKRDRDIMIESGSRWTGPGSTTMGTTRSLLVGLLAVETVFAQARLFGLTQDKPAETPQDMEHMQHASLNGGFMQGAMHHTLAKGVKLEQQIDGHKITVRVGPMNLPAHTNHMKMSQPSDLEWQIPIDGWLLSYTPKLVDANGNAVPGRVLHHVAFWNENRSDFLCPNKEEHIFGAGGELTNWIQIPGYGYRVKKGDKIRIETMVHNPTDISYDKVYLEVSIPYQEESADTGAASMKSYYPAWIDVESCGNSGYDLKPGKSDEKGEVTVKYNGVLLGLGGHMHDYAKELVVENATRKQTLVTLDAKLDAKGQLLSIPVVTFFERHGYPLEAGDELKVVATYDNPTGKLLRDGAMGIAVGYFVALDDAALEGLRHPARSMGHDMSGMTHDH